jgi:hypothetical protein
MRLALSVDGTSAGVFLSHTSGHRGTVPIDPSGVSSARIVFGAATFDTRVAPERSSLPFPQRPAPLGRILHVAEGASANFVGGDASHLELGLVDREDIFQWTAPPRVPVDCASFSLKSAPWTADAVTHGKKELVPKDGRLAVRSAPTGDVVARVRVASVSVTKEENGVSSIVASTPLGTVIGFVDSADLRPPSSPTVGRPGGGAAGSGIGSLRGRRAICPPGTPLLLLRHGHLVRVGRLHDASDGPNEHDWRVDREGRVTLEMEASQPSPHHAVLRDDFRVTNHLSHNGVVGQFVVPLGEGACSLSR